MRRVLSLVAVVLAVGACTIMNDLRLEVVQQDNTPGDDDDAVIDGGKIRLSDGAVVTADGAPASACVLKRPPGPPAKGAAGTDVSIVVAVANMLADPTGPKVGFDQDGICTCIDGAPEACKPKNGAQHCDENNGLDNAGGELFRKLAQNGTAPINVIADANTRIENGNHGNVFRIDGYNGQADDDAVTVTYWPSPGVGAPNFTVVQDWPVGTAVPGGKAYVSNYTLVAQFDKIEVFFLDDINKPVFIDSATLTGTITKGANPTLGTSLLYGRINTTALVQGVGQLAPDSIFNTPICQTGVPYTGIGSGACQQSDLPANATLDKGGNDPCSAISMALELRLVPARVGGQATITRPGDRCGGVTPIVCD